MATSAKLNLISNGSASSSGAFWPGGEGTFHVVGTFGGTTVSLQRLGPDGATWTDIGTDVTLTDEGMGNFNVGPGTIRAAVTGGTPSGLYATVDGTGR